MSKATSSKFAAFDRAATGLIAAFSARNRRITFAVLLGGATIAAANWLAMSQPAGESALGLGSDSASGAVFAPAYGGLVTGLVGGFSRRPVHADASAGTYAAFTGVLFLVALILFARITGNLPEGGSGFERFGPVSIVMFVVLIGSANVFITFPIAFAVMFTSRYTVSNNRHRYGWLNPDEDNPGVATLTTVVRTGVPAGSRSQYSTAYSRFSPSPPRFSKIPDRFLDVERE